MSNSEKLSLPAGEGINLNSTTIEQLKELNDVIYPVASIAGAQVCAPYSDYHQAVTTSETQNDHSQERTSGQILKQVQDDYILRGRRRKVGCAHLRTAKNFAGRRKVAFTLAEVLITLGIIGIVAALTLPTLITNYREKQRVIQLKKTYSTLQQAFVRAQEAHGELQYWDLAVTDTGEVDENGQKILDYSGEEKVLSYLGEFLDTSENNSDFKTTIQKLNGSYAYKVVHYAKQYLKLKDGTIVAMGYVSKGNSSDIIIYYDGCDKKACRIGVNSFFFKLKPKIGLQPLGLPTDTLHSFGGQCNLGQNVTYMNGRGCTAWVIYKENMDYLHCNDLSWNGKSKCKQ